MLVRVISGAFAAALTPLATGGASLDEAAFAPYVEFLAAGEIDGILACGTTGEGILLSVGERRRAAELFVDAARTHGLPVAVHCGAQTTENTATLAAHASDIGAAAVAVIAPPYYVLDERALEAHFAAAAAACAPLPFYVYEFEARAGYAVPVTVVERLRESVPNLRGLKVSDKPWERLEPYLLEGLDVFVGAEALLARGLAHGAAGAVSGLASVYPEVVAALVHERTAERGAEAERLRGELERFPFHAAAKAVVARRGVPIGPDVRAPLRQLTETELAELPLPLP
jgi:dihydrodipicolinate synthase/N-acetylneuraminate lyase